MTNTALETLRTATDDFTVRLVTRVHDVFLPNGWNRITHKNGPDSMLPVMIPLMGYAIAYVQYKNVDDYAHEECYDESDASCDDELGDVLSQLDELRLMVWDAVGGIAVFGAVDETERLTSEVRKLVTSMMNAERLRKLAA